MCVSTWYNLFFFFCIFLLSHSSTCSHISFVFWQGVFASYFSMEDQKILKYLLSFLTLMPGFWVAFSIWKILFIFRLITNKFASFQDCHSPGSFCLWISLQKCSLCPCKYCSATFLLSFFFFFWDYCLPQSPVK